MGCGYLLETWFTDHEVNCRHSSLTMDLAAHLQSDLNRWGLNMDFWDDMFNEEEQSPQDEVIIIICHIFLGIVGAVTYLASYSLYPARRGRHVYHCLCF